MINEILILIGLTMIPALELRASIPYGILVLGMDWSVVFIVCILANIILGPIVYILLDKSVHLVTRIGFIGRIYDRLVERTQKRIEKYVDRYGEMGIAIFIGVPLPGSGSYSGALGAYILGLGMIKFIKANIFGVLIAGILVTIVTLSGNGLFDYILKII